MQNILSKYITSATQIHNGTCYYIGISCETGKGVTINDMEQSGSAHADNQIGYENGLGHILPQPGVRCTNGLYVNISGNASIFYSV